MSDAQDQTPAEWKPVSEAINRGLPKTAIAELDKILKESIAKEQNALTVRALATRATLDGQLEGRDEIHRITRLQSELETAPAPTRPILRAILANWLWGYYQQNQWRFRDRTEIDETGVQDAANDADEAIEPLPIRSAEDLATWSRQKIIAQATLMFQAALADEAVLQNTPIATYDDLLVGGNAPEEYRPTLWDFVVSDAIEFYRDADETYAGPANEFELPCESAIFDDTDQFLAWDVPNTDTQSPLHRATRLYQQWIAYHTKKGNQAARLDADLHRLQFAAEEAIGECKDERYLEALRVFASSNASHPISARAQYQLASNVNDNGDPATARQIALAATQAHPKSIGAAQCRSLVDQIEAPSISVTTERVWNPALDQEVRPEINVTYKNLEKVFFRLVPIDVEKVLKNGRDATQLSGNERQALINAKPAKAWDVSLPKTDDYRTNTNAVSAVMDGLKGGYHLIASTSASFPNEDEYTAFTEVWVSELSMVVQLDYGNGALQGFLVRGKTGQPIANADVRVTGRDQNQIRRGQPDSVSIKTLAELKTDREGKFTFTGKSIRDIRFFAKSGNESLLSDEYYTYQNNDRPQPTQTRSFFFTDRAIYRPGQTVKFKIIATRSNPQTNLYEVATGATLNVELIDANGKVVQTQSLRTNEHGSCHHSFNLPSGGLTGRMMLRINGEYSGAASFNVEEYKRPKFEVELDKPEAPARLDQEVTVPGVAKSYTGAPIDGASVSYTVTRQTQMPPWFGWRCWWMPLPPAFPQTIATGETSTDELGKFEVQFPAIPDSSVDRKNEPVFRYTVTADVTDTTGETRSDTYTVAVGYAMITATLAVENGDWLTDEEPIKIDVRTRTLQDAPASASTKIQVHRLQPPNRIGRKPIGDSMPIPFGDEFGAKNADPENIVVDHDPNSWPVAETVEVFEVTTDASGNGLVSVKLKPGFYRTELSAVDSAGQEVSAILPMRVIDPDATDCDLPIASFVTMPTATVQPGETFLAIWGSGYETARAFVEIEHRGKILQSYWTPAGQTQVKIEQAVDESMRGGFQLRVFSVHENRLYVEQARIDVPWSNKNLSVRWERFVSKLKPGQTETWTAVIEGATEDESGNVRIAEMVATLYDASLELFTPHRWAGGFGLFYQDSARKHNKDQNSLATLQLISALKTTISPSSAISYRDYPAELLSIHGYGRALEMRSFGMQRRGGIAMADSMGMEAEMAFAPAPAAAPMMAKSAAISGDFAVAGSAAEQEQDDANGSGPPSNKPDVDLSDVSPRRNLNETAFFFPELTADENGLVAMKFTMPEALTRWQLIGFAHTNDLAGGSIRDTAVTSKDLMVQPNPPRVLREGDQIEMTVKVTNQSPTAQTGTVALQFNDARTGESVDAKLGNANVRQSFDIPAGRSESFSWAISVPDGIGYLTYKAVGSTGRLSDGEEGYLPVLSRRILVHESIALPIDGAETKTFTLDKLLESEDSSIDSESLTVQMTSNPAWYAIMALPYLMKYPHECSEQTFNRLYANLLARHIATSDPKIERVFNQWRNQPVAAGRETLDSPLEQNEDIASIALTETPWVLEAESESEARRNVGILFDQNRTNDQVDRWTRRLAEMQLPDGQWPWFSGGRSNSFITLYITTGFGRLRHLGVEVDMRSPLKALQSLDRFALEQYNELKNRKPVRDHNYLSPSIALYLYGRSFYLNDQPIDPDAKIAVDYWLDQAVEHWLSLRGRMSQAHVALALKRFGRTKEALAITTSLKERSVTDEIGMHWNDEVRGWFWYEADIESQAMMIEAFDEVADDRSSVESCKAWLLRQKETRSWDTTKATADAVYALLLRGVDLLADQTLVDVKVGQQPVDQSDVEAGTGFFQQRFTADQIAPSMGSITVTKTTPGIAWGGVHWKYFQNVDEVKPHEGTPLTIEKQLFVVRDTPTGEVMQPIVAGESKQAVQVGDEIVARLIIRTDRAMEFIHLKDGRGSGTEPTNVLSGYRYQDGIAYYQSTRDAAEHFFIDYLPKGTIVLESRSRVQLRGEYQSGLATIELMYAPQYNSHSESHVLKVKPN
ncbi:alpha-2-macroglobulin family protein [Neorhodopirellula pilleata]|nr:alpha-2-macroglobulin family protein [Neorhodopirellula pilleata]